MADADAKPYIDSLERIRDTLPGAALGWLRALRERATTQLAAGFPTTRDERWKYTNVAPLLRQPFIPAADDAGAVARATLDAAMAHITGHRLVFVNGHYVAALSATPALPRGALATGLAAALASMPERLEPHLGRIASTTHGFAALNGAYVADGAFVYLPRGVAIETPIHLVFIATAVDALILPRNLIVAEADSRATIVEHYLAVGDPRYLTNTVTEVAADAQARVEHYRVQHEGRKAFHIGGLHVRQGRGSRFTSHAADFGGLLVRNELRSLLDAPGAVCELNGLYVADGRSHVDNHTEIDHAKPEGTSREFYKGVLDGRARAVFNGRVVVRPDAQRTDAQQMNKNLLLSEDAEVDTKPELEIYADDVKCSHGATVGSLDENALFYLRTRALDELAARDLLTYAFAHDVLRRMRLAPVRMQLERQLTARLLGARGVAALELA